jgi:transposase
MSGRGVKQVTAEQVEELGFMPDGTLAVEANRAVSQALGQQIEALGKRLRQRVSVGKALLELR